MKAKQLLGRARVLIYIGVVAVVGYHIMRYDLLTLPAEGCSPLANFSAGDRLVIDRWASDPQQGDAVLFRGSGATLLLGVIAEIPASAPAEMHERMAAGEFWIVTDAPNCPGEDSRRLGPIEADDVVGRIKMRLPW